MPEDPPNEANSASKRSEETRFTAETLIDSVYASFSPRNRTLINRDEIAQVVAALNLKDERSSRKSPSLRVLRLRFAGVKTLRDRPPQEFVYDQTFLPGVNVICIPDNDVGKSSILKTIKYGLTGDDGDYDADVRSWITDVWLAFALDKQEFTTLLSTRGGGSHGLLVPGQEFRPIETVVDQTAIALFDEYGGDAIRAEMQRFIFHRFGLHSLSWTQQDSSTAGGVAKRSASWLTYFQALEIADGGDRYLLCDAQHAMGNQDGLIFSEFLGLNLVQPLNQLGVEALIVKKEVKNEARRTAEEVQQAKEKIDGLEAELQTTRARTKELNAAQTTRRLAVEGGAPARRLLEVQSAIVEKSSEKAELERERDELNRTIRTCRARERQLREAVALHLHFTGLEVSLCPSCDAAVDSQAVEREHTTHVCRLCGKPAQAGDQADIAALTAEADGMKRAIENGICGRDALRARLEVVRRELDSLAIESVSLAEAAQQGIAYALPTPEEEAERTALHERIGRLQAELAVARASAEPPAHEDGERESRVRVLEKVRRMLREEADRRNRPILSQLSTLTQEMTHQIGAESISDVACTPFGVVQLQKHGKLVNFTGIHNEGERLRVKLAFFMAMMRLGRELSLGRHPGFLLIDQPGSSEMVQEDCEALAGVFRHVDTELADKVQIICCTVRQEFEMATDPSKVYGPQALPYAF